MLDTPRDNEVLSESSLAEATESSWNELFSMVKDLKDSVLRTMRKPVAAVGTAALLMSSAGCVEGDMSTEEERGSVENGDIPLSMYYVETLDENTFILNGILKEPALLTTYFSDIEGNIMSITDIELSEGRFAETVIAPDGAKTLHTKVDEDEVSSFEVITLNSVASGAKRPNRDDPFLQ